MFNRFVAVCHDTPGWQTPSDLPNVEMNGSVMNGETLSFRGLIASFQFWVHSAVLVCFRRTTFGY